VTVATVAGLAGYVLRHGDDHLIIAQNLSWWISRAPELEEDIALANIALDHLGVATHLLDYAATLLDDGRDADDLAFLRSEREYVNSLLVEQPNADFAHTVARHYLFDEYQVLVWDALTTCRDEMLAGIAARAVKEATYHVRHSSAWVVRLGDGTDESRRRMRTALGWMWRFTAELFRAEPGDDDLVARRLAPDPRDLAPVWLRRVEAVLGEATLDVPAEGAQRTGGRSGHHTEHLGHLLTDLQWMQRTYPGLEW